MFYFIIMMFCLFSANTGIFAESENNEKDNNKKIIEYIGMDIETSYRILGIPDEIFPLRGKEEWHDDVVFYYNNHIYLFWYQNRVWQLRIDKNSKREFMGIKIGMTKEDLISSLGKPFLEFEGSYIYNIIDKGYPIRLRVFFNKNMIDDAYIYRADF